MNPQARLKAQPQQSIKLDWVTYMLLRDAAIKADRTLAGQVRWLLKSRRAVCPWKATPRP